MSPKSTEYIICGIINRVTVSILALMVVVTSGAWLSLLVVLTPRIPEGARVCAARVTWAFVGFGDFLRKEFDN